MNDESAVTVGCILLVITTPIALVLGFALGVLAAAAYLGVL